MESLEKEVLEIIEQQPQYNPDGSMWRFYVGAWSCTKNYILENWKTDPTMRKRIIQAILSLKIHGLSRRGSG